MMRTPLLSTLAQRAGRSPISELMSRALASPDLISLAAGFVDAATLPLEVASRAAAEILADPVDGRRALQYGTTLGDPALRTRLIRRLELQEGVATGAFEAAVARTIITSGSQQLLYLVAETLLDPGDIVLVESPSYFVFLGLLQARGARAIGVEIDDGGMRIDALEARLAEIEARGELRRVKLIYTVSEHSNPTGLSLDTDRRGALVAAARAWSKTHRIHILEDAAYRGLTYEGAEGASVWSHDLAGDTVILARTFSKTFSPGLKTGWGVVPEAVLGPLSVLKGSHDFGSSQFNQRLLERVLATDAYEAQIQRLCEAYDAKRRATLDALDDYVAPLDCGAHWTRPKGGLYVWLTLPADIDTGGDGAFFERCLENGVLYVPGAHAFPGEPGPVPASCIRLCYGVMSCEQIAEGIRRLARTIQEFCALRNPGAPAKARDERRSGARAYAARPAGA